MDGRRSKKAKNSGRKRTSREEATQKLRSVPLQDRQVVQRAAAVAGISRYMVKELLKEGVVSRRSTRIKPCLTAENKLRRVEFALSFIDESKMTFEPMYNIVHVDEKWFDADKDHRSFISFEDEQLPVRRRQSKRFIPKTMFLAAVARPRFDPHRNAVWDGKLGIWPFAEEYVAKRTSRNRTRGTIIMRNLKTVDREVYRRYLLDYVIPAIKEKWPRKDKKNAIYIQQDNAKPHVSPTDPDILAAGLQDGWNIRLLCQPANSPDTNALDFLGLFASLQSVQYRAPLRGTKEIIEAVQAAYSAMSKDTQENVFLSLQNCMLSMLKVDGDNSITLPHMKKAKLRKHGMLPEVLACDRQLYDQAVELLRNPNRASSIFFQ